MTDQLTQADLAALYAQRRYADIDKARSDGRLNTLMGVAPPLEPSPQVTQAELARLYAERHYGQIADLRKAGRLDDLLNGRATDTPAPVSPEPTQSLAPDAENWRPGYGFRY